MTARALDSRPSSVDRASPRWRHRPVLLLSIWLLSFVGITLFYELELLPPGLVRRLKMGFGVPLAAWFRGELGDYARDVLLDHQSLARGYFRPEAVRRLLDEHAAGRFDHGYRLWGLLFFELWHRQWLDGRGARVAQSQPAIA